MAFTPSNLAIANLGSCQLTIATCNDGVSGTDLWTSGIPDIQGVIPVYTAGSVDAAIRTNTGISISITQSTGTIHVIRASENASISGLTLFVLSGFVSDMTW